MISKNDTEAAESVAQQLANRDLCVVPVGDTPVAQLVDACYSPELHMDGSDVNFVGKAIEQSQKRGPNGEVVHDAIMAEAVELAAGAINGIVTVARSVANPLISDCIESAQEAIDQLSVGKPLYEVVMEYLPPIYGNTALIAMVEKYYNTPAENLQPLSFLPKDPSDEVLLKAGKTGVARVDADLKALYGNDDFKLLNAAWDALRGTTHTGEYSFELLSVVKFVMLRKMSADLTFVGNDIPTDLSYARSAIAKHMAQEGRKMLMALQRDERDRNAGSFIKWWPLPNTKGNIIRVNGNGYKDWLGKGGTPEVLMGAALSQPLTFPSGQMLLDSKERYLKRYQITQQSKLMEDMANQHIEARRALMKCMTRYINEEDALEQKTELHQRLAEWLDRVTITPNTCYQDYCRRMVCEVIYPNNPLIFRMLDSMAGYCKRDDELPVREAATMAVIDILTEWTAKQMLVEPVK